MGMESEQQRAAAIVRLLTLYRPLLDAYVIDFFAEGLWAQLPPWQTALATATPPQSPHLHPLLRRHVKPKKQHEIRRLGKLLQRLSQVTGCDHVVDIGAGQGHLSRYLAFGLGFSVTAVEGDSHLASAAQRYDREVLRELEKRGGPKKKEGEAACHAVEEYRARLDNGDNGTLRVHCYRAVLETLIRASDPTHRHPGVQTVKKAHALSFPQYARLGLPRVGLDPATIPLDSVAIGAMLDQQHKVVAFYSLTLLLAPLVETLILLDRLLYLREQGFHCALVPLFNPRFSPRNVVLVAARTPLDTVLEGLGEEEEEMGGTQPPQKGQSPPMPGPQHQCQ